jgi:Uma2 family endonuclease
VIEVAQSSLDYDRVTKARLYGASGLAEYWIVNLVDNTLDVHRQPTAKGYGSLKSFKPGDTVSPLAFPDLTLAVADILPPAEEK